jgi:poly-gamma-glutamate capsule biosynthesis protein CapA/YwtB (metallophosphatase superfamily)
MSRRWTGAALSIVVLACAPTEPSPTPATSPPAAAIVSPQAKPSGAANPTPSQSPSPIAVVPVVGFWSATAGISRAGLDAALEGRSLAYRRVLVAGASPGATASTPDAIRAAVNADPRTLGLLPASEVTPDVHALAVDGIDLFGNDRLREIADWPLLVTATSSTDPPPFDPDSTWTLVVGGDVMLDRSIYRRTVRQGKGADEPWDGGTAEITGRPCCSAAGHRLPLVRRTGHTGALRAIFRDADLAVINLEGPAVDGFTWHPHGLVFTFDPALLAGLAGAGIDAVTIANNHIGDAGRGGVVETVRHLNELDIAHVGAGRNGTDAHAPAWFDIAGQRVALFGYDAVRPAYNATASRAGSARLLAARYRADIAGARVAGADVVVLFPHWGVEYRAVPTARQRSHARALVAAGAALIVGSHSHWAGAMEQIDGHPVLYSLGNLIFDLTRSEETVEGVIVEVTFIGTRPAQIRLHPTVMVDLVQPNLLEAAGDGAVVIRRMRKASQALPVR